MTNQSVSAGTGPNGVVSGIRWWELRSPNNNPIIFQEGTYAPGLTDGIHRWMGSIAMNSLGDMALGFSASNGTNPSVFPSVFYTARNPADPPGQMNLGEGSIINGTGSQTAGGNRWGDYTAIDIDPVDDTTFWYINEYIPTTSGSGWRLRIGAFNLAGGGTPTPTPTPGTPTPTPTPTPTCASCTDYTTATGTDTIVPGTTDIGNDCDDCTTAITLPFPVCVYGTGYTSAIVESNGTLQFTGDTAFFTSGCNPLPNANYDRTLFAYYDDLRTDDANTPDCVNFAGGCGVFTSVTGSAPNREFHIEWRTGYFGRAGTANFEVRLHESSTDMNVVYGATVDNGQRRPQASSHQVQALPPSSRAATPR